MKKLISAALLLLSSFAANAQYVNWLDSLGYQKPAPVAVTMPNEASATNKYYIDLSSGTGSTCSFASPCDSFTDLNGKTGINGGPAYVYVKGSGAWADQALVGASGNEIVIKPWDDNTTATITGRNNWVSNKRYLIIDGGVNARFRFVLNGANQFDPSIYFNATATAHHHITFYRTRWQVQNAGEHVAAFGGMDNVKWINSEFYALGATDSGNQHHVYLSGCNGGVTLSNVYFINNIFRDSPGEAIELRAAGSGTSMTGFYFWGNVFHDIGKGTCNGGWHCRSAVSIVEDGSGCSGTGSITAPFEFSGNLIWDVGENCIRAWAFPATGKFNHNTCYNWGALNSDSVSASYPAYGIAGFSPVSDYAGVYQDNWFYATGTFNGTTKTAFASGGSATRTFNACPTGHTCGTSNQTITSADFLSLTENSIDFLKPASTSETVNNGTTISGAPVDYTGKVHTVGGASDIGAMEYGTGSTTTRPKAPTTP